jgi:hypothetical protein
MDAIIFIYITELLKGPSGRTHIMQPVDVWHKVRVQYVQEPDSNSALFHPHYTLTLSMTSNRNESISNLVFF